MRSGEYDYDLNAETKVLEKSPLASKGVTFIAVRQCIIPPASNMYT